MGTSTQRELRSQAQALQQNPSTTAVHSRAHLARSKRGAQASRMLRRSGQMSGSIQVKTHAAVSNSRVVSGRTGTITAGCTVGAPPPCGCCTAPGPSNPRCISVMSSSSAISAQRRLPRGTSMLGQCDTKQVLQGIWLMKLLRACIADCRGLPRPLV